MCLIITNMRTLNKASDKIADLLKAKYDVKIQFSASVRVWPEMLNRRFFFCFLSMEVFCLKLKSVTFSNSYSRDCLQKKEKKFGVFEFWRKNAS